MTLIACRNATEEQTEAMLGVFNEMGLAMLIEEKQFAAATSLASCGIAYVMKYVQAAMQAGVEAGLRPAEAKKMVLRHWMVLHVCFCAMNIHIRRLR